MTRFNGDKGKSALIAGWILISIFVLWGFGLASEGGAHGAHASERLWDLGYRFLNFALLVVILFVVIRKTAIKDFFSARRDEIRKRFDNLRQERDATESRYKELEKKIKEFEIEKKRIIEEFRDEGVAEKEKIIAEAKQRAKQILAQADMTIEQEIKTARDRLKQEVLDLAAQKAQEIVAKEINDSDQDQLVDEFIEKVEKLH